MCGLAGIYRPNGAPVDRDLLTRMTTVLAHRGPDGDGYHTEPGVGLGHRRLSIIDVAGGHQPMWNEDDSVVIIFNGEIYNFPELWPKLQALGHVFRSDHSDTEAILHAWESWGPDCLQHLNGQFAFALWDRNQKTLYYTRQPDGTLLFGSEMAALLQVPGLSRRLCPAAIDDFFALGYVPDPRSIYASVQKLPAGHFLMIREGCHEAPRRYWSAPTATQPMDEREAVSGLVSHLTEATRLRLMSDVPLGGQQRRGGDGGRADGHAARDVHDRLSRGR
jgi:asparagine synthase (glutamine-hydrolysing)